MGWIRGTYLSVRHGRECSGIVFVVRRKVGNAVQRNRLKRRLRHICREIYAQESVLHGHSLVVLALPPAVSVRYQQLKEELKNLLSRL